MAIPPNYRDLCGMTTLIDNPWRSWILTTMVVVKEAIMMNRFIGNNITAMFEGVVAGLVLLVLNAIGHHGFGAPEVPYVYGVALVMAIIVTGIRSLRHRHDDPHYGA